jgi:hypothetical protein
MNKNLNIDELLQSLVSSDIEKQNIALEKAVEVVSVLVQTSVNGIITSSQPWLVAERVVKFGSIALESLQDLYLTAPTEKVKIIAALLLLHLGSEIGVSTLLDCIETDDEYAPLVAGKLAEFCIPGASDKIISRLYKLKADDLKIYANVDLIVTLLLALEKLKVDLPTTLKQQFGDPQIPWQIRSIIEANQNK